MNEENKKKPQFPTQMMLMIRAFLGGYVLYLAADILKTENMEDPNMLVILGAVLLIVGGGLVIFFAIRSFFKGEYVGGKADESIQ